MEAAKKRISDIVADLKQRVTIDVVIEQKHHRTIMGSGGSKVKRIQSDHNVDIKFPDRADDTNVRGKLADFASLHLEIYFRGEFMRCNQ